MWKKKGEGRSLKEAGKPEEKSLPSSFFLLPT